MRSSASRRCWPGGRPTTRRSTACSPPGSAPRTTSWPGSPVPPLLDRLLKPFNRLGTQRFLREARVKVWANAIALNRARRQGPDAYAARLAQLEELSAAKVADLQAPGQVLLKLAATGFGVRLPG
jgi:hypothetical protein